MGASAMRIGRTTIARRTTRLPMFRRIMGAVHHHRRLPRLVPALGGPGWRPLRVERAAFRCSWVDSPTAGGRCNRHQGGRDRDGDHDEPNQALSDAGHGLYPPGPAAATTGTRAARTGIATRATRIRTRTTCLMPRVGMGRRQPRPPGSGRPGSGAPPIRFERTFQTIACSSRLPPVVIFVRCSKRSQTALQATFKFASRSL
jgi:hypothetical protein